MTEQSPTQNPFAPPTAYGYYGSPPVPQQVGPAPQSTWAPMPPPRHLVPTSALASPGSRLGAALLNVLLMLVTLGIGYLIWTMVLWNQGTNPGKKVCGLVVVKADTGRVCTWGDMLLRNFVFGYLVMGLISLFTLYIAYFVDLFMIFGERRQRLVDKMAGTLVVQR